MIASVFVTIFFMLLLIDDDVRLRLIGLRGDASILPRKEENPDRMAMIPFCQGPKVSLGCTRSAHRRQSHHHRNCRIRSLMVDLATIVFDWPSNASHSLGDNNMNKVLSLVLHYFFLEREKASVFR